MKVAIFGTGNVGQTFAERFISLGHEVMMGTRNVEQTLKREGNNNNGGSIFKNWISQNGQVKLGTYAEVSKFGDVVLNALSGGATLETFKSIAERDMKDKIIIDIANPLDFSQGFPPSLIQGLNNTNSLGEELQKIVPYAKVVKTLNTMYCGIMVNPAMINQGNHINYLCGNDEEAKTKVKSILNSLGWKNENLLDLGDITNARGTESVLLIWTRIYRATQNGAFNLAIVK